MAKVLVSGSLAYDRIMNYPGLFGDQILPEKVHNINISFLIDQLSVEYGGCAGNIAYNLALLGETPQIICTVGKDFAPYKEHLASVGIDASSLKVADDQMTSSAYIFTDRGDNQIAAFHPGAGSLANGPAITSDASFAIVSPSAVDDMIALPQQYKAENFTYFFDPGQQTTALSPEQLEAGISGAQILFCNDYELTLILQKTGWTEDTLMQHVPTLVVTLAEKGVRIREKDGEKSVHAVTVLHAVDPTGAGDAFRAGFMKGMLQKWPLEECAQLGCAVASFCVEVHGTQNHRFTSEDLKAKYKKAYGEIVSL